MTNEERKQLIGEAIGAASMCWCETPTGIFDSTRASKIADRVTAALEAERVGEVVLGNGIVVFDKIDGSIEFEREATCGGKTWVGIDGEVIDGRKGSLIFREDK